MQNEFCAVKVLAKLAKDRRRQERLEKQLKRGVAFNVHAIHKRRFNVVRRRAEYLTEWSGYAERTWEPRKNFGAYWNSRLRELDATARAAGRCKTGRQSLRPKFRMRMNTSVKSAREAGISSRSAAMEPSVAGA